MSSIVIEKRMYLDPKFLDQDIETHIFNELSKIIVNECSEEYGYILSVQNIISYYNLEDTIFIVKFNAAVLKPEAGKILSGKVCMIIKDGILIDINNRQKLLIPSSNLEFFELNLIENAYVYGDVKIKVGDEVKSEVIFTKYVDQKFCCYGKLANNFVKSIQH